MNTVYDWLTVAAFGALVVLFLHRSVEDKPRDHAYQYAPPVLGCPLANYLGNHGYDLLAVVVLLAIGVYVAFVLEPFGNHPRHGV